MRFAGSLSLVALCLLAGCRNASRPEAATGKAMPSALEADLKRFLSRAAPEPTKAAAFDQEADENHWPVINRRSEEKKLEIPSALPSLKSTLSVTGVLKTRGGGSPQAIKGVWLYAWQGAIDFKDAKGRAVMLSLAEAEELTRAIDFATSFLGKIPADSKDDLSFSQSVSRDVQIFVRVNPEKEALKSGGPFITLYCRDASLRLKADQLPLLKQHVVAAKTWAEGQKDDFALLPPDPAHK